jgi:hypothetical protein
MIEDDRLKIIISEFAEKHDILPMKYVYELFDNGDYYAIDRKYFISVDEYSEKTTEVTIGIILVLYENIDEDGDLLFSLEKESIVSFDMFYYSTEKSLMEDMVNVCEKNGIIQIYNEWSD